MRNACWIAYIPEACQRVHPCTADGKPVLYRVRLGPISSVPEFDELGRQTEGTRVPRCAPGDGLSNAGRFTLEL